MPGLVKLYIRQVITGFGLSALFVGMLLWANVANLGALIGASDMGWVAVVMLWVFNGIVFAGVQFAIVIMRLGSDGPTGGRRAPRLNGARARVRVAAGKAVDPLGRK
ncbi:MAG: hypothetical protein ACRBB0_20370 [Pelagimonas sp.]|uniref:hypothetical protein n=1 Tax=Pelagimonas sp. TaxID=2073170 RepID=UPI003D6C51ED